MVHKSLVILVLKLKDRSLKTLYKNVLIMHILSVSISIFISIWINIYTHTYTLAFFSPNLSIHPSIHPSIFIYCLISHWHFQLQSNTTELMLSFLLFYLLYLTVRNLLLIIHKICVSSVLECTWNRGGIAISYPFAKQTAG